MNKNSTAIILLCSTLCLGENTNPYNASEWTNLASTLLTEDLQPYELLGFTDDDFKSKLNFSKEEIERIKKLIDRSGSIAFEIEKYESIGIKIATRADIGYPNALKTKLGKTCPPLFYYVGDLNLARCDSIGFIGTGSTNNEDIAFTAKTVSTINAKGLAVVSSGAKGVDTIATSTSIANGCVAIEYISDALIKRTKSKDSINAIRNKQLLILSTTKPDARSTIEQNKLIYAQSIGTVVVKSDLNKGDTWNSANEALNNQLCPILCWNKDDYPGNMELVKRGCMPIDDNWDGDILNNKIIYHN